MVANNVDESGAVDFEEPASPYSRKGLISNAHFTDTSMLQHRYST